ncbi:histidine phosphatase superfamily [Schizophyllum amplum]|uniref:Histidine phosphatase superfamily n=1 Tax=Schizophyllum amplum TaxID=97359 RepID=A0A550C1H0_9AGAR|nr:histidine phosphatase superfamily [Auriculariopsis ampla]
MSPLATVYIVRHGETEENLKMIMQGHMDTQLNETGRQQARLVADAMRDIDLDRAYSSDLSRARETAKAILEKHEGVQLIEDEALRERHLGQLQGKQVGTRISTDDDPSMEPHSKVAGRALAWWDQYIVAPAKSPDASPFKALVVSHGGFISMLVKALLNNGRASVASGVSTQSRILNASITTIEVSRAVDGKVRGVVVRCSDAGHLERAEGVEVLQASADEMARG